MGWVRTEKRAFLREHKRVLAKKGVNAAIYNVKDPTKTKKVFVKKGEDYEPPKDGH